MLYAILATDAKASAARRAANRIGHLAYVQQLADTGALIVAGPHPAIDSPDPGDAGFTGSLIIADFDSLKDAERWARQDPYMLAGVFSEVVIKPFIHVLP